jgi:hypothetical protein
MKKIIILLSIVFISNFSFGQWQQSKIDLSFPNESVPLKQNDPNLLENLAKNNSKLTYSDIEGTAFWKEAWQKAYMYTQAGNIILLEKAKMNLYSGELHYISATGTELAVETSAVSKVVFMQAKDSTKMDAVFAVLANYVDSKPVAFFRVFNTGKYQLVLLEQKKVKTSPYDPFQAKAISSFYSNYNYALYNNGEILPLIDLNKSSVLSNLPSSAGYENWLKEHKNKLNNKADVVSFLNYVNGL